MDVVRMVRADLPALYRAASDASRAGRRTVVRLTAILLLAGLGSALFGLAGGAQGPPWHVAADLAAALLFAVATVGGARLGSGKAQRRWSDGRAAAESIKTLSWKYAMRAAPFDEDATADERFLERMREILFAMSHLALTGASTAAPKFMISPAMQHLRKAPLAVRHSSYERYRLRDQIQWYAAKAAAAKRRGQRWRALTIVLGVTGFVGALARAFGVFNIDALGVAAACLASIAAWTQLRQYWPNVAAYRLALSELEIIVAESRGVAASTAALGAFCDRAETAISREHTMWLARSR
jgi:hypothetical protein